MQIISLERASFATASNLIMFNYLTRPLGKKYQISRLALWRVKKQLHGEVCTHMYVHDVRLAAVITRAVCIRFLPHSTLSAAAAATQST